MAPLTRHLVAAGRITVVTGAGISVASGIPTFRGTDPDAVWKKDVTEMGTFRYFREDPVGSWRWYSSRFATVLDAEPNAAHRALVDLERWQLARGGSFVVITQNIDSLHERAGATELIKVHGSADRVRCASVGCRHGSPTGSLARGDVDLDTFLADPSDATLPRCPACGDVLRQHVLWFDEYYGEHADYQWQRVQEAAATMDLLLFVGTSFSVGVTELFLRAALQAGIPAFSIDPGGTQPPYPGVEVVAEKAEVLLPEIVARLAAG